jgi:hypothetical protein
MPDLDCWTFPHSAYLRSVVNNSPTLQVRHRRILGRIVGRYPVPEKGEKS